MEFIATSKYVRVSPRKARLVAGAIKNLSVVRALGQLQFLPRASSLPILKTLKSVIANSKLDPKDLKIKNIAIDEGTRMKRQDTSHRVSRDRGVIQKRTSHIKIILTNGK